jgi:hypothetical protein
MSTEIHFDPAAPGYPPLMLVFTETISVDVRERMRHEMNRAQQTGRPLVVMGPVSVYQLLDGRWELLPSHSADGAET